MANLSDYIKYSPKQQQVADLVGSGDIILIGGKKWGGKSYGLGNIAMETAICFPGIKVTIVRSVRSQLMENFWTSMLGRFPKSIFGYRTNVNDKAWYFNNKSSIHFNSYLYEKDMKKGRGIGSDVIMPDEIQDFTPKQIRELIIHTRDTGGYTGSKPFHATFIGSCNPGGVSHRWLKEHFVFPDYSKWGEEELKLKDKFKFIEFGLYDNTMITETQRNEYDMKLNILPDAERKAYKEGCWDAFEGQFFQSFNYYKHSIEPFEIPKDWKRQIGFDKGGGSENHPSVMLFAAQDPKTLKVYIYKEMVVIGSLPELAKKIIKETENERIMSWWADPQVFKYYTDDGHPMSDFFHNWQPCIPFEAANNKREEGWAIVKAWLYHSDTVEPMLQIFKTCRLLLDTFPILQYTNEQGSKKEDLNSRQDDDACDALRYLLSSGYEYPTPQMIEFSNRVVIPRITVPNLRETYNLTYHSPKRLSRASY